MAKTTNFATITAEKMETLSKFNVADRTIKAIRAEYREKIKLVDEKIEKVKADRKSELENGMSVDDVTRKFPLESLISERNKLENERDEKLEPFRKDYNECLDELVPENIEYAYAGFMESGSVDCKPTITLKKGKKTETVTLTKSPKEFMKDFLIDLGINCDNQTALNKTATKLLIWIGGKRKNNKGSDYVTNKSSRQIAELLVLSLLQILVFEKQSVVENEDYTLSVKVYDNEKTESVETVA